MSEAEPIAFRPRKQGVSDKSKSSSSSSSTSSSPVPVSQQQPRQVCFNRTELNQILAVYGRKVAAGDWRDYAMDFGKDKAVFSVFQRTSECPLYRIEKTPKLARKQGAFAVVSAHGLILKRGHELHAVLKVLDKSLRLVEH